MLNSERVRNTRCMNQVWLVLAFAAIGLLDPSTGTAQADTSYVVNLSVRLEVDGRIREREVAGVHFPYGVEKKMALVEYLLGTKISRTESGSLRVRFDVYESNRATNTRRRIGGTEVSTELNSPNEMHWEERDLSLDVTFIIGLKP